MPLMYQVSVSPPKSFSHDIVIVKPQLPFKFLPFCWVATSGFKAYNNYNLPVAIEYEFVTSVVIESSEFLLLLL